MNITIEYEASWRNSFLDGSNNEVIPRKGRGFVASAQKLKANEDHFIQREVTIDTVLGVLNRLIGDQRKLYQSRQRLGGMNHYFEDIVPRISFEDIPTTTSEEIVFIRNMTGNTDQNKFTGVVSSNAPIFTSDFSSQFWGVLGLDVAGLTDFVVNDLRVNEIISLNPINIVKTFGRIGKTKTPELDKDKLLKAVELLRNKFPEYTPYNEKGTLRVVPFYCASLYLQLDRLEKAGYDMTTAKSKSGLISGVSKNNFTAKDFMKQYTSGGQKLVYGNPYIRETRVRGEGSVKHILKKANGLLKVEIDVDREKAIEIETLIQCAGVSSFYLGKKGLAYVSKIRI